MRIRRVLALLLSLSITVLTCCAGAAASDWTSIEDLPISPEDELADLQDWLTAAALDEAPAGSVEAPSGADAAAEDDIMPLVDMPISYPSTGWHFKRQSGNLYYYTGATVGTITRFTTYGSSTLRNLTYTPLSDGGFYFTYQSTSSAVQENPGYIWGETLNFVCDVYCDNLGLPSNTETILLTAPKLTGDNRFIAQCNNFSAAYVYFLPQYYYVLVNGQVYGARHTFGGGDDLIDVSTLGAEVTSLGWRFEFGNQTMTSSRITLNGSIYPLFRFSSSNATDFFVFETGNAGLLGNIIEWLKKIVDGITSIGNAIAALPSKLITLLSDLLRSLFIPDQASIQAMFAKYNKLLEDKLGFIWQLFQFVETAFSGLINGFTSGTAYSFTFPGVSVELVGETYEILPAMPVSLDNALMSVLRPVVGTIFSFLSIAWVVNKAEDMVIALLSGASYLSWHNVSNLEGFL